MGSGRVVWGNEALINQLRVPVEEGEIVEWVEGLFSNSIMMQGLGDLAGPVKAWQRLFDGYLYLRPLALKYLGDQAVREFEQTVFHEDLLTFYQKFFLGEMEPLPWSRVGVECLQFNLDTLVRS